jgi:hypothetical protein
LVTPYPRLAPVFYENRNIPKDDENMRPNFCRLHWELSRQLDIIKSAGDQVTCSI